MQDYNSRIVQGEDVARTIWGEGYGELLRAIMNSYDPAFTDVIVSFFGHTYARKALAVKDRPVIMDFVVDPEECVYPMVPAGAPISNMILL